MASHAHKHYVWIAAALLGMTLLPIIALNMLLSARTLGDNDKVIQASSWQQRTHGVTYAPTLSDTALFKALRLHDRLPEINTVVLGSSTALGITQDMFPAPLKTYNFAQTGHGLLAVIGEAEWLISHADKVRYVVVPLDWSLGFVYQAGEPVSFDLAAATTQRTATHDVPLSNRMVDALSYPRVANLLDALRMIAQSGGRSSAFRQYFLQGVSDDYLCADGTPAKDFDSIHWGSCTGFRFDGSATFANSDPVKDARPLVYSATTSSSKYVLNLTKTSGEPSAVVLSRLSGLARQAEQKGGKLLLFMPPLLPGMEDAFARHTQLAPILAHTKTTLRTWAERENIPLIDAGASERFGCDAGEFIDEHHALPSCYRKIIPQFWRRVAPPAK